MGSYKQRTISELLKRTSKLHKPRMTAVLEGKARMQGPLDETDNEVDYKALEACANCRNHLDGNQSQNCSLCGAGYHSFCLEMPDNAAPDAIKCCYKCQGQPAHCIPNEAASERVCEEQALAASASKLNEDTQRSMEQTDVLKCTSSISRETSLCKTMYDSSGTFLDSAQKSPIIHRARKMGVRRKITVDFDRTSSPEQAVAPDSEDIEVLTLGSLSVANETPIPKQISESGGSSEKEVVAEDSVSQMVAKNETSNSEIKQQNEYHQVNVSGQNDNIQRIIERPLGNKNEQTPSLSPRTTKPTMVSTTQVTSTAFSHGGKDDSGLQGDEANILEKPAQGTQTRGAKVLDKERERNQGDIHRQKETSPCEVSNVKVGASDGETAQSGHVSGLSPKKKSSTNKVRVMKGGITGTQASENEACASQDDQICVGSVHKTDNKVQDVELIADVQMSDAFITVVTNAVARNNHDDTNMSNSPLPSPQTNVQAHRSHSPTSGVSAEAISAERKTKPLLAVKDEQMAIPRGADTLHTNSEKNFGGQLDVAAVKKKGESEEEILQKADACESMETERLPSDLDANLPLPLITEGSSVDDVRICDVCGDAGYDDVLAICSDCNAGEHVYCVQNLLGQVPEGYYQCEGCKLKQRVEGMRHSDSRPNPILTRSPSMSNTRKQSNVGNARSRISALLQKRRLGPDKKRALKGVPVSQLPAKRFAADDVVDAPVTKKQMVENMGPSVQVVQNQPQKPGLSRDGSFKIPDTGKVKFVSHTSTSHVGEGAGPLRSGKIAPTVGFSPSHPLRSSNPVQSGQTLKGRLVSAPSSAGVASVSVNTVKASGGTQTSSQPANASSNTSTGLKSSGSSKHIDAMPSFLLPSKSSFASKGQISGKISRETSEVGAQLVPRDGLSGHSQITRTPVRMNASRLPKAVGPINVEHKTKLDNNQVPLLVPGVKGTHSDVDVIKMVESKGDVGFRREGAPASPLENKSRANGPTEVTKSLDSHNINPVSSSRMDQSEKLVKHELSNVQQVKDIPLKNEASLVSPNRVDSVTPVESVSSSQVTDFGNASFEENKRVALLATSSKVATTKATESLRVDTSKAVALATPDENQTSASGSHQITSQIVKEPFTACEEAGRILQPSHHGISNIEALPLDEVSEKSAADGLAKNEEGRGNVPAKSRSHLMWGPSSFAPSLGSTRCYRCKELGHTAKTCSNRVSTASISSDTVSALKSAVSNVDNISSAKLKIPVSEMASIAKTTGVSREMASKVVLSQLPNLHEQQQQLPIEVPSPVSNSLEAEQKEELHTLEQDINEKSDTKIHTGESLLGSHERVRLPESLISKIAPVNIVSDVSQNPALPATAAASSLPAAIQLSLLPKDNQDVVIPVPVSKGTAGASIISGSVGVPSVPSNHLVTRYQESAKVYPEAQIVWQGTFEVTGNGNSQFSFHGLQANPSNRALPKVREVAKKLEASLPLEELPRSSEHNSWPVQFQKSPPINDNIALYFFASGKESHTLSYIPLVERLMKHDLALKGYIEDAELLIFPSNLLPPGSQCWNNFMFLWAVFRDRKPTPKQSGSHPAVTAPKHLKSLSDSRLLQPASGSSLKDEEFVTSQSKKGDLSEVMGTESERLGPDRVQEVKDVGSIGLIESSFPVIDQLPCQQSIQASAPPAQAAAKSSEQLEHQEQVSLSSTIAVFAPDLAETVPEATFQQLNRRSLEGHVQLLVPSAKVVEEGDSHTDNMAATTPKPVNASVCPSSIDKSRPFQSSAPTVMVSSSPPERQADVWTPGKFPCSSPRSPTRYQDRDKGIRERIFERNLDSDRDLEKGFYRERERDKDRDRDRNRDRDKDRDKYRDRDKDRDRDRDRDKNRERERFKENYRDRRKEKERDWDRQRRQWEWERGRERERNRERNRDRDWDRDKERDKTRERDRDRGRERDRDREWERDRKVRDWGRERQRERERERVKDMEQEREVALGRDRGKLRHRELADIGPDRDGKHWYQNPVPGSPSWSPSGHRERSRSQSRSDRHFDRHRSFRHSRSNSHSADSAQSGQHNTESRERSQGSFAQKGKLQRDSIVERKVTRDGTAEEQGNGSQRESNSESLCREKTNGSRERPIAVADLNMIPMDIDGSEYDVATSEEVKLDAVPNHYSDVPKGILVGSSMEQGECSNSASKHLEYPGSLNVSTLDDENECRSFSPVKKSTVSSYPYGISSEPSTSWLNLPPARSTVFSVPDLELPVQESTASVPDMELPTHRMNVPDVKVSSDRVHVPDLNLTLGAMNPPQQRELPLFMQLLDTKQHSENDYLGVVFMDPREPPGLSLSLSIPEPSQHPGTEVGSEEYVSTSLRLFG